MKKPKTPEKAKNKTNSQQCISLHITLPQIVPLRNDTKALKIMFPAAKKKMTKPEMPEKSQKQKPTCNSAFHYILPSTNCTFTKRH